MTAPAQAGFSTLGSQTLVGRCPALVALVERAQCLVRNGFAGALVVGEAGTGKELLARGLHYAGPESHQPFLSFNSGAVPEHLVGPELLGSHPTLMAGDPPPRRGILELAASGTLFIDEITRIPPELQARLAQAIGERRVCRMGGERPVPVACRIVLATTRVPEASLARGELHPLLFDRVAAATLELPPLRARGPEDVELLAQYFLHLHAGEHGLVKKLDRGAIEVLMAYEWPGNVRELRLVVERAAATSEGPVVRAEHVIVQHRTARSAASSALAPAAEIHIPAAGRTLAEIEADAIALTLQLTRGNQSAAARVLGIARPTLARKLRDAGLRSRTPA
ncbi:MAG TPA: sigma 54-interacting transcriptional regulator [Longimicrobium sp.]|nr:sigma 54-interacting transcriptional regulator [Longimicrobium sp.]